MTRDEVTKGLQRIIYDHITDCEGCGWEKVDHEVLDAAIAYMQPSDDAAIAAAREWLHRLAERYENIGHKRTVLKSLDALAREPGLWTEIERMRHLADVESAKKDDALARIAALESEQRDYEKTCVRLNAQVNAIEASRRRAVDDAAEMAARVDRANARLALVLEAHADQATRGGQCGCVVSRVVNALVTDAGPARKP